MEKTKELAIVDGVTLSVKGSFKLRMSSGRVSIKLSTPPALIDVTPTIEVLEATIVPSIPED